MVSTGIIGAGIGFDFLLTGGVTTAVVLAATGVAGALNLFVADVLRCKEEWKNPAGQTIKSDAFVSQALVGMEEKLKIAFNKASAPGATSADRENLNLLAQEIGQDVKTLFPVFEICSGENQYEFVVAETYVGPGKKELTTLAQALQKLNTPPVILPPVQKPAPKQGMSEETIRSIQERLKALETPKVVVLDKGPRPPAA